jgi:hypothetical protein
VGFRPGENLNKSGVEMLNTSKLFEELRQEKNRK